MKIILLFSGSLVLGLVILALADHLGFDVAYPRGAKLLCLLDLAVVKGWLWIQVFKELAK